uniref:Acidic protein n=1 Tax=Hordeum vulgare subsp. vulgare TaxID=112509 RepID=A0A8I6WP87_HORVV
MAKSWQMFVTLMSLLLLCTGLRVHGGEDANIKTSSIPVQPARRVLPATYFPQTTVSRQCDPCGCSHDNDKTFYDTICCNEITCNDPAHPSGTCTVQKVSCGCDVKTCK